jgi:simple sugar transport system ATP-binding protein
VSEKNYVVQMIGITKSFPGVVANKNIDFDLKKGEIHGLLGENGAGKTTLMNILYGFYRPDEGEIYIEGKRVKMRSPKDALKLGIGMVYQHFTLVPEFKVVENVMLGMDIVGQKIGLKATASLIEEQAKQLGFTVNPWSKVADLSLGEQQRVEILKVLLRGAKVIILDEPTSVLAPVEVAGLFNVLKQLASQGKSIVFITHKLNEAMELCDRITVLRTGRKIGTLDKSEITSTLEIVRMMFGVEAEPALAAEVPRTFGKEVLKVENLVVQSDRGVDAVKGVSFSIREGEILGLAGIDGNGQKELAEALSGIRSIKSGKIYFKGEDVTRLGAGDLHVRGISYITDDRISEGLIQDFTLAENITLKDFRKNDMKRSLFLDWKKASKIAKEVIKEYELAVAKPNSLVQTLSGGTQQKLLVAREIGGEASLIIANQPTHGVDAKTTAYIRKKLVEKASKGAAVLLISNDLDEIFSCANTIAVIYEGKILGILDRQSATREDIAYLMIGVKRD